MSLERENENGKTIVQEVNVNHVSEADGSDWEYESDEGGIEGREVGNYSDHGDAEELELGSEGEDEEYREAVQNLRQGQGVLEDEDEHLSALNPRFFLEDDELSNVESDYVVFDEVMDESTRDDGIPVLGGQKRFTMIQGITIGYECSSKYEVYFWSSM